MEVLRSYETSGSSHPTHNVTVRHYEILQVLSTTYSPLVPHLCQLNPTPNHTLVSVIFLVFRPEVPNLFSAEPLRAPRALPRGSAAAQGKQNK